RTKTHGIGFSSLLPPIARATTILGSSAESVDPAPDVRHQPPPVRHFVSQDRLLCKDTSLDTTNSPEPAKLSKLSRQVRASLVGLDRVLSPKQSQREALTGHSGLVLKPTV